MDRVQAAAITSSASGNWSGAATSAWPLTNRTGTVAAATTSSAVTGTGTLFTTELTIGNIISTQSGLALGTVSVITDNTHLTLTTNSSSNASTLSYRSDGVGSGDSVTIASGHTIAMDETNATVTALTIASPTAANGLTIATGKSLTVTGAITFTANAAANAQTITLQGTGHLGAGSIVTSASTSTGASIITCASGAMATLTVSGNIALTGSGVTSSNGPKIDFGTTSTGCSLTAGSVTLTGGTVGAALLKMGTGTFTLDGSLTGAGTAAKAQFTTAGAATIVLNNGTIGIGDTLSIAAGTDVTATGTSAISYATAVTTFGDLTVQSGTLSLSGAAETFTSITILPSATLAPAAHLITDAGNFVSSGTYNGSAGLTMTGTSALFDGPGAYTNTGILTMSTGNKTITSIVNTSFAGGIAISGAITVTNNGTVNVTSTTGLTGTVAGSTWVNAANSILLDAGAMLATGTLTATAANNLVNYNGAAQTLKAATYYNLILAGTGIKTMTGLTTVSGTFSDLGGTATVPLTSIGGDFEVNGGTPTLSGALVITGDLNVISGTLTTGAVAMTVDGNTTVSGGILSLTNSTGNKTMVSSVTVNAGTLNGAATTIFFQNGLTQNAGTVAITGTATFNTNSQALNGTIGITTLVVATGVTLTNNDTLTSTTLTATGGFVNDGTVTIAVGGALTGGGSWTQGVGALLNAGGATTSAMGVTTTDFTTNINTVTYDGTAQTVKATPYSYLLLSNSGVKTLTSFSSVDNDMTLSGTATATLASNATVGGNLAVQAGTTLTTGNFTFGVTGNTLVSGTLTHSGSAAVTFDGDLIVNGTLSGAGAGTITGNGDVTGTGTITLTGNTLEQRVSANQSFGQVSGANTWTFKNLTFSNASPGATPLVVATQTGGTGGMTLTGLLTLGKVGDTSGATTTLDPGDEVWTLSGTGTVFTLVANLGSLCDPGTCPDNTSIFKYTGATATAIGASDGYYEVMRNPTIAGAITDTTPTGPITAYHRITLDPTKATTAACLTMNLGGDLTVTNGPLILEGTTFGCSVLNTTASHFNITVDSLTITQGPGTGATDNLIANASLITLANPTAPLTIGASLATFTYNTSTVSFTGNGASIPALSGSAGTNGYFGLNVSPSAGTNAVLGTATAQTIQVNGSLTVGDGTNAGASAATFDPVITVLGNVVIAANATLVATTGAFNVSGSWADNGTFTANSSTVTFNGSVAGKTIMTSGDPFNDLQINSPTVGTWTLQDPLTVTSTMTLVKGTLDTGSSQPIELKGGWNESAGFTFNPNASIVSLTGTVGQHIAPTGETFATLVDSNTSTGGVVFASSFTAANFVINSAGLGSASTIYFAAPSTYTITTISWTGGAGHLIRLRSLTSGTPWTLTNVTSNNVTYVDVKDSNAHNGQTIDAKQTSTDSGNNTNWSFGVLGVSFTPKGYGFGSVAMAATAVSTSAIVVTNLGDGTETYSLSISTTAGTLWTVDTSTPTGLDRFSMFGLFNSAQPVAGDFHIDDIMIGTPSTASAAVFSGDQTGLSTPAASTRNFWMRLDMPLTTSTTAQAGIQVTVTASSP